MKIGIDFYSYNPQSTDGVSTFSIGLARGLIDSKSGNLSILFIVSEKNEKFFKDNFCNEKVHFYRHIPGPFSRYINRLLWIISWGLRNFRLRYWYEIIFRRSINKLIENKIDALIVPTTVLNFYDLRIPTILCIHDIQQEYHPENFTFNQIILRWASYRLSCDRASSVQVSSRYIYNCLLEKFNFLPKNKIFIAPEGVDVNKFSDSAKSNMPKSIEDIFSKRFIFYPAQIWKHKNHILLLKALKLFQERKGFEFSCVLTGHDYGYWNEVNQKKLDLGLKSIYYLGRVELAELIWIYKNCSAVLALGIHESSSLPVREGASFGKPLVCSDISPNLETSEFLKLNIFKQNSCENLAEILIEIYDNKNNICDAALNNVKLVGALRWDVISKIYIDRILSDSMI